MSHSVTIHTTRTTTSGSTIIMNTSYLRTFPGILKFLQVALGIVCVGIIGHDYSYDNFGNQRTTTPFIFFFLMTTTFMIASVILLISCLASLSTGSIISKTIYEVIYHSIAFGLLLAASLNLLVSISKYESYRNYNAIMAASVMGLVNAALYFLSTILALKTYRGI